MSGFDFFVPPVRAEPDTPLPPSSAPSGPAAENPILNPAVDVRSHRTTAGDVGEQGTCVTQAPSTLAERAAAIDWSTIPPARWLSQPVATCRATVAPAGDRPETAREAQKTAILTRPVLSPVASVATVAGWREGIAFMLALPMRAGYGIRRWQRLQRGFKDFDKRWLEKAHALGWTSRDLFGCYRNPKAGRLDCNGLVYGLDGLKLLELHADHAVIEAEKRLGHRYTFRRAYGPSPEALLCWHVFAALPPAIEGADEPEV